MLRLLRSDRPRILIADEVGVGKTIEAGLILKEMQSRQPLDNIIIVCPKALVSKWCSEMRRFDEDFYPLNAASLRYCLRETQNDGEWPVKYSRAIIHLELFRMPDFLSGTEGRNPLPGLATLDPPAKFSLAIFDEAHHLRNADTSSHKLAQLICNNSEVVVFLSATPVHLGSKNLFTLLNLLRPELFSNDALFHEMALPNRYLNQAMRHIRSQQPAASWAADAITNLTTAADTSWGKYYLSTELRFRSCLETLASTKELTADKRIHSLRDLEELHTFAHVMNRTRRRDIGNFTIREPHTVNVPFTAAQEMFYRALIDFRVQVLNLNYDPLVIRLIIDMLERQASSCLPALLPMLDTFIETGHFSATQIADSWDNEDESDFELPGILRQEAQNLRAQAQKLPAEDPKLKALINISHDTVKGSGSCKLLIFSFFIHTLNYLEQNLRHAGFRVGIITGETPDDNRESSHSGASRAHLRNQFRKPHDDPDALDILLSSEVGCEGLDYEFCDRLVNYDIPWNPMRLEQRIGRIDRFGQRSEKVFIFNFVTPGTIEERIFFRCYERLGIFRNTIGDCEEILGDANFIDDLFKLSRDPNLTPEQAAIKAQQIADNALRLTEEQRRLEQEGGGLLGLDHLFSEEVDAAKAEGRFVTSEQILAMVRFFVSQPNFGGALEPHPENPLLFRLRLNKDARSILANELRSWASPNRMLIEFRRWLEGSDPFLLVTFDQATAVEHRELPFITPVHPLARMAVKSLEQNKRPFAANLRLRNNELPIGKYIFTCDLWETVAIRPEIRLIVLAWNLDKQCDSPEITRQLLRSLDNTETADTPATDLLGIEQAINNLDKRIQSELDAALAQLILQNAQLIEQKLASLDAYYRNRLTRIKTELANIRDVRIQRMKTAELSNIESDYTIRRAEINRRREADIVRECIAIGILEVYHAE